MKEGFWRLFCATGMTVFYLLYLEEERAAQLARTAWSAQSAARMS